MARRQAKPKPKPAPDLSRWFRGEVVGSALVLLALLTLLSLLTPNRGDLTEALISAMRVGFGVGVWLMPVVLGALGFWLALRQVAESPVVWRRRIAGGVGLFLAFEGAAHFLAGAGDPWELALAGEGGGATGWLLSQGLVVALGLPATIGTLLVLALASIFTLSNLSVAQLRAGATDLVHRLRGTSPGPEGVRVNPPLPLGHPTPFWRR